MSQYQILFLLGIAGHILCGICDCLLIFLPNGRFSFAAMKDNEKLSEIFRDAPLSYSIWSILLGCISMSLSVFGYFGIYAWMSQYSAVHAGIILVSIVMIYIFGISHHILCGIPEWLYIRMNRTEEAREIILELFKKTSLTMIVCYLGFLIFGVTLCLAVVTGVTSLPLWGCIFNITLFMVILLPMHVPGAGNWAGAFMFLGLLFLI